jgi:hypothetical protein
MTYVWKKERNGLLDHKFKTRIKKTHQNTFSRFLVRSTQEKHTYKSFTMFLGQSWMVFSFHVELTDSVMQRM